MDIQKKLETVIGIFENSLPIRDAHQFVQLLKPILRQQAKNSFVKVGFDKSEHQGAVYIRFVRKQPKEVTSAKCVEESDLRFIISVEGFTPEGTFEEGSYNEYSIKLCEYNNKKEGVRRIREKTFTNLEAVKTYIESYFKKHSNQFSMEEDAVAPISGGGTVSANIAPVKSKLGEPMIQPPIPNKKKKTKFERSLS